MYRFQWLIVGEVSQLFWVLIRWRRWLSWANYERKFWCGKWSWVNQPSLHGEVDDNPSWDFFHTVQVIRWRTMKREMVGACHYFTIVNLHVAIAAHVVVVSFQLHYYVIRTIDDGMVTMELEKWYAVWIWDSVHWIALDWIVGWIVTRKLDLINKWLRCKYCISVCELWTLISKIENWLQFEPDYLDWLYFITTIEFFERQLKPTPPMPKHQS